MMTLFVTKTVYLILYAWAVSRSCSLDLSRKKRCTVEVALDNIVSILVCICYKTWDLLFSFSKLFARCSEAKRAWSLIAVLYLHNRKVNRRGVYPCTCTCF